MTRREIAEKETREATDGENALGGSNVKPTMHYIHTVTLLRPQHVHRRVWHVY